MMKIKSTFRRHKRKWSKQRNKKFIIFIHGEFYFNLLLEGWFD